MTARGELPQFFSKSSIHFLKALKRNNQKAWFDSHRDDYEQSILAPMKNLVLALTPCMLSVDPAIETRPAVNKTISRIQRDTRFARDKSPYKTTLWITFKRPGQLWQERPAFFLEIGPDLYRYGMGFYAASKTAMDRLREQMEKKPRVFLKLFERLEKNWQIEGEQYKRMKTPALPEQLQAWYCRKNLYLVRNRAPNALLFSSDLAEVVGAYFLELAEIYHLLSSLSATNP